MEFNQKKIQLQYEGFRNTPALWKKNKMCNLCQFEFDNNSISTFSGNILKHERLGKRVERFVEHQLCDYSYISILAKNTQIQDGTTTIGEIDFIISKNEIPIHLEVIYKFYVYDESQHHSALEHWIGPNKKDSLIEKLNKLKNKQLPLLYKKQTAALLNDLKLNPTKIKQQVLFKAQLFVPIHLINHSFENINNQCIKGFYIHHSQLSQFLDCKFYIPSKENWLLEVQAQTNWLSFSNFSIKINELVAQEISPLCWIKKPNGQLQKFFVIWWN